jgi:hypothetical protein
VKQQSKKKKQSPAMRKSAALVPVRGESIEQVDAGGLYREVCASWMKRAVARRGW